MRFRRRIFVGGLVLVVIAVFVLGERRMPTGPDGGGDSRGNGNEGRLPVEFQVATFNIHGCRGGDGRRDTGRVAKYLAGLDIVGLNEVHGSVWSEPHDQVTYLAELCGLPEENYIFAPAETQWFGTKRFGNGLLTGKGLLAWQRIPLPRRYDRSCRNMLVAQVKGASGMVTVLITHVTRSNEREREIQLEAVLKLFASLEPPAILLADLNTPPGDPRMDRFLAESDAVDAIQEGGVSGRDRVDWILIRGLKCLSSERVDNDASDHPLFTARLVCPGLLGSIASSWTNPEISPSAIPKPGLIKPSRRTCSQETITRQLSARTGRFLGMVSGRSTRVEWGDEF